jgi:two-component system sensor histidine kinase KdpD
MPWRRKQMRDLGVVVASLAAIALTASLLRLLPDISPTTVSLILLLIVLGTATIGRLRAAIVASVASMLSLNFFFLPPVGAFTIADPQNWIALFAFLVVSVIASNLSAAAQDRTREAIARRNEVTRLFDLTRDVLLTTETTGAIDALARHVARRFELSRIAICLPVDDGWRIHQGGAEEVDIDVNTLNMALAKARGIVEFDARQRAYGGHVRLANGNDISIVPLRHGTRAVGLLAASSSTIDIGTLDALAGVVAIAIERAQFLAERDAAELVQQKADLAATLLASLSHDLRTPLTAIKAAVENLRGHLTAEKNAPIRRARRPLSLIDSLACFRTFSTWLALMRPPFASTGSGSPPQTLSTPRVHTSGTRWRDVPSAWTPTPTWRSISIRASRRSPCRTFSRTRPSIRHQIVRFWCRLTSNRRPACVGD